MAAGIKMPLGMEVGLGPGDFLLDRTPLPSPKNGAEPSPKFTAHVYCGQTAGWMKIVVGMEVRLSPDDFTLHGDPAPLSKQGAEPPIFGTCLLRPNGCMDQDATWYEGRPQLRRLCVRWGPSSPPQKGGGAPSQFSAHVHCGQTAGWIKMALGMVVGLGPRHIVLGGDPALLPKRGKEPPIFRPIGIVAKRLDASRCHLVWR